MKGFWRYLRFISKRERVISGIWMVSIILFTYAIAAYYPTLFPSAQEIASVTEMMKSPAMIGMMGPVYGGDLPSVAILFSAEMSVWLFITVAVMNIFFVNRHTRRDEELGRLEMFCALPVGRITGAVGVMFSAFVINIVIALFSIGLITSVNMDGGDLTGAAAYSLAVFAVGFLFAAITLFMAQLFSTSRSVNGMSFALVGIFYLLRASGDIGNNALAYISPLGLGLRVFAFDKNNFWCVAVLLFESAVITAIAFAVLRMRDHGQGLIPAKKGKANASRFLQGSFGLAWRLVRNSTLIWCAAMFIIGAMYGSMFRDIESFINQNEYYKQIFTGGTDVTGSMIDNFAAFLFVILSIISAIPIIGTALKTHSEERRGRLEPVLVRSVLRTKMLGSYIVIGVVQSIVIQLCGALGVYAPSGGLVQLGDMLAASLAYVPALLMMLGLVVFFVGVVPKLSGLIWAVYAYAAFAAIFLRMFDLPEWLGKISPFGNVPQLPLQEFDIFPLAVLTIIAILLALMGILGFQRRDIG